MSISIKPTKTGQVFNSGLKRRPAVKKVVELGTVAAIGKEFLFPGTSLAATTKPVELNNREPQITEVRTEKIKQENPQLLAQRISFDAGVSFRVGNTLIQLTGTYVNYNNSRFFLGNDGLYYGTFNNQYIRCSHENNILIWNNRTVLSNVTFGNARQTRMVHVNQTGAGGTFNWNFDPSRSDLSRSDQLFANEALHQCPQSNNVDITATWNGGNSPVQISNINCGGGLQQNQDFSLTVQQTGSTDYNWTINSVQNPGSAWSDQSYAQYAQYALARCPLGTTRAFITSTFNGVQNPTGISVHTLNCNR